jgi:hypothetical protein
MLADRHQHVPAPRGLRPNSTKPPPGSATSASSIINESQQQVPHVPCSAGGRGSMVLFSNGRSHGGVNRPAAERVEGEEGYHFHRKLQKFKIPLYLTRCYFSPPFYTPSLFYFTPFMFISCD